MEILPNLNKQLNQDRTVKKQKKSMINYAKK